MSIILFPSDYFDIKAVDSDLKEEYDAVVESGLFDIALFGYDAWFNNGSGRWRGVRLIRRTGLRTVFQITLSDAEVILNRIASNNNGFLS